MNERKANFIKFLSCAALLLVAYIPMIKWMWDRWMASESYYSHGFLIPIISLYVVWQRREILKKIELSGEMKGLFIVAAGLLVHIICASLKVYFISGASFVLALYGLILFFFGKEMVRNLIFPLLFLLAMVPLPLVVVGNLTVKLKLFAAQMSTFILNHIGFPSFRDGSIIRMPNSFIEVAAPCSGLRSLISLITLGLIFSYFMKISYFKKVVLFLSSIPIAIAANIVRILVVAIVNDLYGSKIAMGKFHDFTGFMVFALAFLSLMAVAKILEPKKDENQ